MKRSPIKRNSGLRRGKTPFRSAAKLKSHKRIKPISDKRKKSLPSRRECVEIVRRRCDGLCEMGERIAAVDPSHRCTLYFEDAHEMLPRSGGGDETNPDECLGSCRACHDWAHFKKPKLARQIGLVRSRYNNTEESAPTAATDLLSGLGDLLGGGASRDRER